MNTTIGRGAGCTSFDGAGRMGVVARDVDGQVRILSATVARSIGGTPYLAIQCEYLCPFPWIGWPSTGTENCPRTGSKPWYPGEIGKQTAPALAPGIWPPQQRK